MANIPIIGKVIVGGVAKDIKGGYVNIGGVWKPIVKTYVNVNGVWKSAWKNLYTWKKYTVAQTTGAPYTSIKSARMQTNYSLPQTIRGASKYTFNASTGIYTLTNSGSYSIADMGNINKYHMFNNASNGAVMYEYEYGQKISSSTYMMRYYKWTATPSVVQAQGDYISDVTSEIESAYPTNGVHTDGYWYVKQ